jgi:translation elongation factor EF-Tu-like GTPase
MMKKILARLKLYSGINKRKTAFVDGYRPLFDIEGHGLTSGMITLLDRKEFMPGDEGVVEVKFLDAGIVEGAKFHFYEAVEPLGECLVLEVLDIGTAS